MLIINCLHAAHIWVRQKNIKMKYFILLIWLTLNLQIILAQQNITYLKGKVFEQNQEKEIPVIGANVYWQNTTVGTVTDINGNFKLSKLKTNNKLVISYVGYRSDTIIVENQEYLSIAVYSTQKLIRTSLLH